MASSELAALKGIIFNATDAINKPRREPQMVSQMVSGFPSALSHAEEGSSKQRNRTRVEILVNILDVAHDGALKTHIMYKANLSHRQLERYMTFLESNGLLRAVWGLSSRKLRYQVTEKGINFLSEYSRLSNYFSEKSL